MNNDIAFIKQCCEIADGWEYAFYDGDLFIAPNGWYCDSFGGGQIVDESWEKVYFPLLTYQTADKLGIDIMYFPRSNTWAWTKYTETDDQEDGEYYETANEARIAGIKEVLRGKNQ